MSVVLRCPTCGTTQDHVGECEACFEGEVQYFCTNHDEGVWLESPVCGRCGAKLGDPPRRAQAPRVRTAPTRPAGAPDFRPPARGRTPGAPSEPDFGRRRPERHEPGTPVEPEVLPRTPSLGELIEEITEGPRRTRDPYEREEVPWVEPPAHRPRVPLFPVAGCLVRVAGLVFVLIAAAIIFLFLLFSGFIVS